MIKKKILLTSGLFFLFISSLITAQASPVSEVWVDDDFDASTPGWGVTHFDAIQDGIDALDAQGTAHVMNGEYYENVLINKQVDLRGEDRTSTFIDGGLTGSVIQILPDGDYTEIRGFTIRWSEASLPHSGILSEFADNLTIADNVITNCQIGLNLCNGSGHMISDNETIHCAYRCVSITGHQGDICNITITGNYLSTAEDGIVLDHDTGYICENITISDNTIDDCSSQTLHITDMDNSSILNNDLFVCFPIRLEHGSCNNTIDGNNLFVTNPYWDAFKLYFDCDNNTITNNYIEAELHVYQSRFNTISRNIFMHRGCISIQGDNNLVLENTINHCDRKGISVYNDYNTISGNRSSGEYGVYLHGGFNNLINENQLVNNTADGIHIRYSSDNIITDNVIADNLQIGVHVIYNSYNNEIYHNRIINNTSGNAYTDSTNQIWDNGYPSGGNYWSSYLGGDIDGDGIGDTPHTFDDHGVDNYPLMEPPGGGSVWANGFLIAANQGSSIDISLHAGKGNAWRIYLLLGSTSGTEPGIVLPGGMAVLPVNWDLFTDFIFANLNSLAFSYFIGVLDSEGSAHAQLNTGPLPPDYVGQSASFAFTCNMPFDVASNPLTLTVVD